jgi:mono/diheme cytochrome c family protein
MKTLFGVIVVLLLAGLVPFGLIALARSTPSASPPISPIQNMNCQPKFKAQRVNVMFADGRAMRPLLAGVEARQDLLVPNEMLDDPAYPRLLDDRRRPLAPVGEADYARVFQGTESGAHDKTAFVARIPVPVSMDLMRRGQERFNVYCAPCHGESGYGDGMVARKAAEMQAAGADTASGWVAPTNYHSDEIRGRAVGQLYNTIANGVRSMPSYAKQISVLDRWAIVAYVKALQRSQHARSEDVPAGAEGRE